MHIAGICGSLRKASFNRALLRLAQKHFPADVTFVAVEFADLPLFNADIEDPPPPPVAAFNAALTAADGLLISTPEYNYSVPGVLKNAIDWTSRAEPATLERKPVAIMGGSVGRFGSVRSQLALRQVLLALNCAVLSTPELYVSNIGKLVDADGAIADPFVVKTVDELCAALVAAVRAAAPG